MRIPEYAGSALGRVVGQHAGPTSAGEQQPLSSQDSCETLSLLQRYEAKITANAAALGHRLAHNAST